MSIEFVFKSDPEMSPKFFPKPLDDAGAHIRLFFINFDDALGRMLTEPFPLGTLGEDFFYINCKVSKLSKECESREITATFFIEKRGGEQSNAI
jgi:hypothetical protein